MEIRMTITPPEPEVRTLADVPENVLCVSGEGPDAGLMWRQGSSGYSFGNTCGAYLCNGHPKSFLVSEVLGPFRLVVTGTGRGRKFELAVDWPEKEEPKTLADVGEGVVCLDTDGDITWKDGYKAMYAKNGHIPRILITNPSGIEITKVLGRIKFSWDKQ